MLPDIRDYDRLVAEFRWKIPARYNIGVDVCDRWAEAEPERVAVLDVGPDGQVNPLTYGGLRDASNRLANVLGSQGVGVGDRVAILLPQGATVPVAHVAVYKMGAVALPLAALFGVDALGYRLRDAGATALITNAAGLAKVTEIRADLPDLKTVLSVDGADGSTLGLFEGLERASPDFAPVDTGADDPALMIYTSGTTGPAKGALHGHRVCSATCRAWKCRTSSCPSPATGSGRPADWAWAGGLLNFLLPGLHFGVPVAAKKTEKFDPEEAFRLMARWRCATPSCRRPALRMLRTVANPGGRFDLRLRTIASGGEALGAETFAWGREALGLTINEFYGQTECNLVLSSCAAIGVARPGRIGKPVPGHRVGSSGMTARWPSPANRARLRCCAPTR
jgi:acetyl-CoA synthetase